MTSLVGEVEKNPPFYPKQCHPRRLYCRHAIRSKNLFKPKCRQYLKRKFKKYRLRLDGKEDQEVIDVSQVLISSLRIKSPNKKDSFDLDFESWKPRNYLFKMVKRKQDLFTEDQSNSSFEVELLNKETEESPNSIEKKQTDAFKLLMDSRNKSIGSNSPGKIKPVDETQEQQLLEKKNAKIKRNLLLQKMAEAKGSLKRKELEEHQDKLIKKKMEKRAEKLKSMILNKEPKATKMEEQNFSVKDDHKKDKIVEIPKKTLQLVSLFDECIDNVSPEKRIPREDAEFLKKLSPSIKKKESMLSYFKKVDKEEEPAGDTENDSTIIKVKFPTKLKKKGKNKQRSILKDNSNNEELIEVFIPIIDDESTETVTENNKERRKRKRNIKDIVNGDVKSTEIAVKESINDDNRPRRNTKKPVKYSDDIYITSSDEELHIFTPKKKKHVENKIPDDIIDVDDKIIQKQKSEKSKNKTFKETKKEKSSPKKLAPIFVKNQPSPADNEAKQKFLQSGVPEQLKKLMAKPKHTSFISNDFVKVVHVQQLNNISNSISITDYKSKSQIETDEEDNIISNDTIFKKLLNLSSMQTTVAYHPSNQNSLQVTLQYLKDSYLRFPVYRTYRLLRSKKKGEYKDNLNYVDIHNSVEIVNCSIDEQTDNPEQLNWCDKYKPQTSSQIIGNFDCIKDLKKWLISWTENLKQLKKAKQTESSDSSDFYYSDVDSKDSSKLNNNLLIIYGPVGCGKTSSVYAVAAELCIKVIEVNASSKRTGKIILQDLQEATQSHKVNRGTSNENSQSSQKSDTVSETKVKKRGRPKKVEHKAKVMADKNNLISSQENTRTGMSLILIDDADIVFDQDDGFCSAISQLICSSKRPVILITSSLSCPHLQKFIQIGKVLNMNSLLPNMLGTWLDIMCLADSGTCSPGTGAKILDYFHGDIRKTINCLQFYICSQDQPIVLGDICSQNVDSGKFSNDDENSNLSWIDQTTESKQYDKSDSDYVWKHFISNQISWQKFRYPFQLFNIWWSVPKLLSLTNDGNETQNVENEKQISDYKYLESLSIILDTLSTCDYLSLDKANRYPDITSNPWYPTECDSVSEIDCSAKYDKKYEINNEIAYELLTSTFKIEQNKLGVENIYDLDFPGMSAQREKNKITSRHNHLNNFLSPQAVLDRKALALDYWSSCRTICRAEKTKTDSHFKRNNRFCHYLKSLGIHCKNDSYDNLADSLSNYK